MSVLSERLKDARECSNLKQTQVKERTGINNKTLSGYENGVSVPDPDTLSRLADLYDVSVDYLYGRTDKKHYHELTEKDEKDVAKRLEKVKKDLENAEDGDGYMLLGEPISEEAKQSIIEAMEFAIRQSKRINKKYTPKKYRKE
ncbi:MAG: helix-turn-helix transcriptional regulator [Sporolactobacillus sp.]